jgi:hypothetical protein
VYKYALLIDQETIRDGIMKLTNAASNAMLGGLSGWIIVAALIWLFGETWFAGMDATLLLSFSTLMVNAGLVLSVVFLLVLGATYRFSSTMGKVWGVLGLGMALWLAGEVTYFTFALQGLEPFPSIADIFYYLAYIPLTIGLVMQMRLLKLDLKTSEKAVIALFSLIAGAAIVFFALYPAIQKLLAEALDLVGILAGSMYPVLDIVLLSCVFIVSAKLRHGKLNAAWILILAGLVLTTVADNLYWISYSQDVVAMFSWYDLAFLASYVLVAMGAIKGLNIISTTG